MRDTKIIQTQGLLSVAVLLLTVSPVSISAAQQAPVTQQRFSFHIAAKPVPQGVNDIGRITGLSVVFRENAPISASGKPLNGSMTAQQALVTLLSGTGLTYRFANNNTVMVFNAGKVAGNDGVGADGSIVLEPITIQGRSEQWGRTDGFVAAKSVSGTKTDTPLIETPQSVTVVSRKEIETRQAQSVPEVLSYTPGVVEPFGRSGQRDDIYSRGFAVSQYLNGLRLTDGTWGINQIDPYLLERVERIGGPASVLYGQASPGGVIELVSKRPTDEPLHEVSLQTGSYGRAQGTFDFSGPVDKEGQWSYRITGIGRVTDTQIDYTRDRRIAIAPALTWAPDADTTLTFLASYQNDPDLGNYYTLPSQGTVLRNPLGQIPTSFYGGDPSFNEYSRESTSIGYALEHRINPNWVVRQNLRYRHMKAVLGAVFDFGLGEDNRTLKRYALYDEDKLGQFTVDNQSEFKFDTGPLQHTLLMGLDYQRTTLEQTYGLNFGLPGLDIFKPVYNIGITRPAISGHTDQVRSQLGIYAQDQLKIDNLSIVGGLRQDWISGKTTNKIEGVVTDDADDNALTGRIGAVYLFSNGLAPYISYSTSFQPTGGTDANKNAFKPTEGKQYEAGVKYQPDGYESFITAAVFDLKQTNVKTTDPDNPTFSNQIGEVHARGVELSAVASVLDNLNVRASYTHITNVVSRSLDPSWVGNDLVGLPRDMASIWADYTFAEGKASGLKLGLGIRYEGKRNGNETNTLTIPAFTLVDAAIGYDFGIANSKLKGWNVALNATNLFDKKYVASCNGDTICYYGLRRSVLGTMSYKW